MKRLTLKRRLYLERRERRASRRTKKRNARRAVSRRNLLEFGYLMAPKIFGLANDHHRRLLLRFLARLRYLVFMQHRNVQIDFSGTERMFADGTLLFAAELNRLIRIADREIKLRCVPPHNQKVSQVLKQVEIYKLLRYRKPVPLNHADVVNWRFATGSGADGQKYETILGQYDGKIALALSEGLYIGLTEAMTNCHNHAYIASRQDGLGVAQEYKAWWMFSQERNGWLTVVFCDLGVGIPETLPQTQPALWRRILSTGISNDGIAIREAVQESKTRTGKRYRGKGLKQLVNAVENTPGGLLRIYSNSGWYNYKKGAVSDGNHRDSIYGTLISWMLPIVSEE